MTASLSTNRVLIRETLLPGTTVKARGLTWEVVHVQPAGQELRYRLRCTASDLRGDEIDLLSPFERIDPLTTGLNPKKAGRLKEWLLFHEAFLLEQALGPAALLAVQPGRLNIAPYQLVPVMRALSMTRPRLLLADGVGLGKTIEAGLIIAELIARRRAHRVLIVSPAGPLLQQWHNEMSLRFGLRFDAVRDWGALQEKRRELVLGANPFDHLGMCLLSIDFAKQEKVLLDLERATWDLVIIDEAHHCVSLGVTGDGEDSRRRRLAEVLARQTDGLLLLTATPHDGYDPHFASLLELLDPSLVDGRGTIRGNAYKRHIVRRLKHHIKDPKTGEELFKKRIVTPRPVVFSSELHPRFAALQKGLLALVAPRLKEAVRKRRFGDVLAFVSLLKRSVSSVRACQSTLRAIAERYSDLVTRGLEDEEARKQRLRSLADYQRRVERYGALSAEEEADQALLEAEDMAAHLMNAQPEGLADQLDELVAGLKRETRREKTRQKARDSTLQALETLVELCEGTEDPKVQRLIEEAQEIRAHEPNANILVYTEYTDSQAALVDGLKAAIKNHTLAGAVLAIQGEDPEKTRLVVTARFQSEDGLILVSTDATAEGLNLQERCHHLLHLELPYNPNRLEQRNGRIDRYGQTREPQVRYLYLAGTFEERILLRLVAKYERQRARLTFVPNTLGLVVREDQRATERLLEGLGDEDSHLFKREPGSDSVFQSDHDDVSQPAYKDLLSEIENAIGGFEKSAKTHAWLGDAGLNSETTRLQEATEALRTGTALGAGDLVRFVCDALETETKMTVERDGDVLLLKLPPSWVHGLEGLPGWEPETATLRVTTNAALLVDKEERPVGFLGRAHPIVRRALDRVRNIPLGDGAATLDRRITAVSGDGPALVYTFLCTVRSEAGRELERVLAVSIKPDGEPVVMTSPEQWTALARRECAVATSGVWEKHFVSWAAVREEQARAAARGAFEVLAETFMATQRTELAAERLELERWADGRADEICGPRQTQLELGMDMSTATWRTARGATERLAGVATEPTMPPPRRQEAAGVLALLRTRLDKLEGRQHTVTMPPATLGLLMVVPQGVQL
jgi:ERCC4-related helicase